MQIVMTQLDWLLLYKELQTRKFKGNLNLQKLEIPSWFRIPDNLQVLGWLDLSYLNISKLSKNLECDNLWLDTCKNLKELPEGLKVKNIFNLSGSSIEKLPKSLQCETLFLDNCKNLKELPEGLNVKKLFIRNSSLTKKYCEQQKQQRKISYINLY